MIGLDPFKQELGDKIKENISFSSLTTLKIGGPARLFIEVNKEEELKKVVESARRHKIPFIVIAGGSNLLVSDSGYDGLVIKVNITGIEQKNGLVRVMAGTNLQNLVNFCNTHGLSGLEKLAGIPGTVGGAIYGNAGAYGQTISDKLTKVRAFDGVKDSCLTKKECEFDYRESGFKRKKKLIIIEAEFKLDKGNPETLQKTSQEIIRTREKKYHPDIKCPGSFFKNVHAEDIPKKALAKIPKEKIIYGKIPAGYLLEAVGANGKRKNGIQIAAYHGNLFINRGGGTAVDFYTLAKEYQTKVRKKFGITLEPEVQFLGFQRLF